MPYFFSKFSLSLSLSLVYLILFCFVYEIYFLHGAGFVILREEGGAVFSFGQAPFYVVSLISCFFFPSPFSFLPCAFSLDLIYLFIITRLPSILLNTFWLEF